MLLSLAEQLLYYTIRIAASRYGKAISTGTGFFFQFSLPDNRYCPCLITNKHVLAGADELSAICHLDDEKNPGHPADTLGAMTFNIATSLIFYHPEMGVDLVAIPIASIYDPSARCWKTAFSCNLGSIANSEGRRLAKL